MNFNYPVALNPLPSITPIESSINSLELESKEEETKQLPPFFPCFFGDDQAEYELYQAGILCDEVGTPHPDFDRPYFPPLNSRVGEENRIIKQIENFLSNLRNIHFNMPQELIDKGLLESFKVLFSFKKIFEHLITYTSKPFCDEAGNAYTFPPLTEIEHIGQSTLGISEGYPVYKASLLFLTKNKKDKPGLDEGRIKALLKQESVQRRLHREGSDFDFRLHIKANKAYFNLLLDEVLNYLASQLKNFPNLAQFYISYLNQHRSEEEKKRNFDYSKLSSEKLAFICLQKFGGISKRWVSSDNPENFDLSQKADLYAILGIHADPKDVDCTFVNALYNSHTFSTNVLRIPYKKLLERNQNKPFKLEFNCDPFSATKYVTDLICGFCSIFDLTKLTAAHFLTFLSFSTCLNNRLPLPVEKNIVQAFLNNQDKFIEEKKKRVKDPNKPIYSSIGYYLYSSLKEHLNKHHEKQPHTAVILLFNACRMLKSHVVISDEDILFVWQRMAKSGLLALDSKQTENAFYHCIKEAVLTDKIPFSQVLNWIQVLAFIGSPRSLSKHNGSNPAFRIAVPDSHHKLSLLLPFIPSDSLQDFSRNLETATCPRFMELYQLLNKNNKPYPSPLIPFADHLKLDHDQLVRIADGFIHHLDPFISHLGVQLYLSIPNLKPAHSDLRTIFLNLPKLASQEDTESLLENLGKMLFEHRMDGFIPLLYSFKRQQKISQNLMMDWIKTLAYAGDPLFIEWAYRLFKTYSKDHSIDKRACLELFNALRLNHPIYACSILKALLQQYPLTLQENLRCFCLLAQSYKQNKQKVINLDFSILNELVYSLLQSDNLDLNQSQQNVLSESLAYVIQSLHQDHIQITVGDDLLLKASRKGYVKNPELFNSWIERLEQFDCHPRSAKSSLSAAFLFDIALKENFLDSNNEEHKQRVQIYEVKLIQQLQKDQSELAQTFLKHLLTQQILLDTREDFSQCLMVYIQERLKNNQIDVFTFTLIDKLLVIGIHKHQTSIQTLLQEYLELIEHSENELTEELLNEIDRILLQRKLDSSFLNPVLSDYLEATLNKFPNSRFSIFWSLFEKLNPFTEQPKSIRTIKILVKILKQAKEASFILPVPVKNWIEKQHFKILTALKQPNCTLEAADFLILLHENSCSIQSLEVSSYSVWLSRKLLSGPTEKPVNQIIQILNYEDNLMLKKLLKNKQDFILQVIQALLEDPTEQNSLEAFKWIKIYLELGFSNSQEKEKLENFILTCTSILVECEQWVKAYEILDCCSSQHPDACTYWLAILPRLQEQSFPKMADVLLQLSSSPLFNEHLNILKKLAQKEVEILLLQPMQSHLKTVMTLLSEFHIQDVDVWTATWKEISSTQDSSLIKEAWSVFKEFESQTKTHAFAEAWALIFKCLSGSKHADIGSYLDSEDFFESVYGSLELITQKWRIEAYLHVVVGTISQLSPQKLDPSILTQITGKKAEILMTFEEQMSEHQELQELDPSLKDLDWQITLALTIQLAECRNPSYLDNSCQLLEQLITHPNGRATSAKLVKLLEKMTKSYSATSQSEDLQYKLTEKINSILRIALKHFFASHQASFMPLVPYLLQKSFPDNLETALMITSNTLDSGLTEVTKKLKPSFISLILDSLSHAHQAIDLVATCLEKGIVVFSLSAEERSQLCGEYLHFNLIQHYKIFQSLKNSPVTTEIIQNEMNLTMELYKKWAPFVFANPKLLKNCIDLILKISEEYKEIPIIIPLESKFKKFKSLLFKRFALTVLKVKYQVPSSPKTNDECLKSYIKCLIEGWKELSIGIPNLLEILLEMIPYVIDENNLTNYEEDIHQLFGFTYFFVSLSGDKSGFLELIQVIAKQAYINNKPSLLKTISNETLKLYLNSNIPNNIYEAIKFIDFISPTLMKYQDCDTLVFLNDQIIAALKKDPDLKYQLVEKETLLKHLFKATFLKKDITESFDQSNLKSMLKVLQTQFDLAVKFGDFFINDPNSSEDMQVHYLQLALTLLKCQAKCPSSSNKSSRYFVSVMPLLHGFLIRKKTLDFSFNQDSFHFTREFIEILIYEERLRLNILSEWLTFLKKAKGKDATQTNLIRHHVLITLTQATFREFLTNKEKEHISLFANTINWIQEQADSYLALVLTTLQISFYDIENYEKYYEKIDALINKLQFLPHFFSQFDFNLAELISDIIYNKTPDNLKDFQIKQKTLLLFIEVFQATFERQSLAVKLNYINQDQSTLVFSHEPSMQDIQEQENAQNYLLYLLGQGMEKGVFNEKSSRAAFIFEKIKIWMLVKRNPHHLLILELLDIRFYASKAKSYVDYCQSLEKLIPALLKSIFVTQNFTASHCFLAALFHQYSVLESKEEETRTEVLISWLTQFHKAWELNSANPSSSNLQGIEKHMAIFAAKVFKHGLVNQKTEKDILYFNKFKEIISVWLPKENSTKIINDINYLIF